MSPELALALGLAVAFAVTNGLHDSSNAIAALVATRGATPGQAVMLAAIFNVLGPLLIGGAVAHTVGGIVAVEGADAVAVIGAGLAAAVGWNLLTWYTGLPSSSGHALVGGLVGAALAAGGPSSVNWGGFSGGTPTGVVGTLAALAISPLLGLVFGAVTILGLRRAGRRWTRRWRTPVRTGQWTMSAALAFSHGANDTQKTVGVVAALLVAGGELQTMQASVSIELVCSAALTAGTALGGWRIVRTIGRGIYRIDPLDGLACETASAGVIFGAVLVGAPVSTTQTVASSVVGVGGGRGRWRHVRWEAVRAISLAWLLTIPASAALAMLVVTMWDGLS